MWWATVLGRVDTRRERKQSQWKKKTTTLRRENVGGSAWFERGTESIKNFNKNQWKVRQQTQTRAFCHALDREHIKAQGFGTRNGHYWNHGRRFYLVNIGDRHPLISLYLTLSSSIWQGKDKHSPCWLASLEHPCGEWQWGCWERCSRQPESCQLFCELKGSSHPSWRAQCHHSSGL